MSYTCTVTCSFYCFMCIWKTASIQVGIFLLSRRNKGWCADFEILSRRALFKTITVVWKQLGAKTLCFSPAPTFWPLSIKSSKLPLKHPSRLLASDSWSGLGHWSAGVVLLSVLPSSCVAACAALPAALHCRVAVAVSQLKAWLVSLLSNIQTLPGVLM